MYPAEVDGACLAFALRQFALRSRSIHHSSLGPLVLLHSFYRHQYNLPSDSLRSSQYPNNAYTQYDYYRQQQQNMQQALQGNYGGHQNYRQPARKQQRYQPQKIVDMTKPNKKPKTQHGGHRGSYANMYHAPLVYNAGVERQFFDKIRDTMTSQSRDGGAWSEFLKVSDSEMLIEPCQSEYGRSVRSSLVGNNEPLMSSNSSLRSSHSAWTCTRRKSSPAPKCFSSLRTSSASTPTFSWNSSPSCPPARLRRSCTTTLGTPSPSPRSTFPAAVSARPLTARSPATTPPPPAQSARRRRPTSSTIFGCPCPSEARSPTPFATCARTNMRRPFSAARTR